MLGKGWSWHEGKAARTNWLVSPHGQPCPYFGASNRCGLKCWSQRKERESRANPRTLSRANGRKPRRPASWDGMRLVPPFVAFVVGAEGGILASSHFPSDSDGNHWGCIEKDFQALFKSFTGLYSAGQPPGAAADPSLSFLGWLRRALCGGRKMDQLFLWSWAF